MANGLHRAKLCEGALAWNVWRENNPDVVPDLDEVILAPSQRLFGFDHWGPIDLKRARLAKADLRFACLTAADLEEANLAQARLTHALLERANLRRANLTQALLDDADLADARLDGAVVKGANLAEARNLTQAQIERCVGDPETRLPPGLVMPLAWLRENALSVGGRRPLNGQSLGPGSSDATALAAEEVFKTLARVKAAALANADRTAERGNGRATRGAKGRRVARTLTKPRSSALARSLIAFVVLVALAALALALYVRQPPPAKPAKPRHVAGRVMDAVAPLTLAATAGREVLEERAGSETIAVKRADETEPIAQAPPASTVEPRVLFAAPPDGESRVVTEPRATAENADSPFLAPVGDPPIAESRNRRAAATGRRRVPTTMSVEKIAPRPRVSREANPVPAAEAEPSPHPFAAKPCKPPPACVAGLEFCAC